MSEDPIGRLITATQRGLWQAAVRRRVPSAAWLAALALAGSGLVALLSDVRPPPLLVVGVGTALFLAGLLPGLVARPGAREAALYLDRHFASHELLTSALEVAGAGTQSPATDTLLLRARQAARDWYAGRDYRVAQPGVTQAVLALIPAFVGVLLLQYVAVGQRTGADAATAGAGRNTDTVPIRGADAQETALRQLRRSLKPTAGDGTEADTDELRAREIADRVVPGEPVVAGRPDGPRQEIAAPPDPTGGLATGTGGADGIEAGMARPGDADTMSDDGSGEAVGRGQAVAREGAARATGAAANDGYAAGRTPGLAPARVRPAAAPPATGAWSTMSAAQAAYARRYLEDAGAQDD
ncbi:MAG: hypothetical protein P8172_05285 [Gammaproteobacteria bacterium]